MCPSLVAEAVADAFTDALVHNGPLFRTWQQAGKPGLARGIRQAAWRRLRGHLRRHSTRCEVSEHPIEEYPDARTPEAACASREALQHLEILIGQAATRYGGHQAQALRVALWNCFEGDKDTEVARTHRLPREYVNRAKRWVMNAFRAL
jgi:hypothetical protein